MFLCQRTEEEPGDYVILSGCGGQRRRPPPPEPEGCLPQRSRRRTSVQTPRVRRRPVPLDLDSSVCQLSLGESRHRPQPLGLALLPSDWWPVVPQPSPLLVRIALSSTVPISTDHKYIYTPTNEALRESKRVVCIFIINVDLQPPNPWRSPAFTLINYYSGWEFALQKVKTGIKGFFRS